MPTDDIRTRVTRFANALAFALYDRKVEARGSAIIHYYDADVILDMVLGIERGDIYLQKDSEQALVRALLSAGFLGDMHMLRPHVFELNENLRREERSRLSDEQFQGKARGFLTKTGILDKMAQLHEIVDGATPLPSDNQETRIQRFVHALGQVAGETFARMEQCHGRWPSRLHRYLHRKENRLCLDRLGPETETLLKDCGSQLYEINRRLMRRRPERSLNVFQDAAALTILHSMIQAVASTEPVEVVRFYTETVAVREAIEEDADLRKMLSYSPSILPGLEAPAGAELVLRDSQYYIVRAVFPVLSPDNKDTDEEALGNLDKLSSELKGLESHPEELERAIEELKYDGRSLGDLLRRFENLTIMDYIWTSKRIPPDLKDLPVLKEWVSVFAFAEKTEVDQRVGEQWENARTELESSISGVQVWTANFRRLLSLAEQRRERGPGRIEDPMRDLGLVRWGYDLTDDELQDLRETLDGLLWETDVDLTEHVGKLTTRMVQAREDLRQCFASCAILWAIGAYESILDLVKQYEDSDKPPKLPPSLTIIKMAASVRAGRVNSHAERKQMAEQVTQLCSGLPESKRSRILLGAGYVLYHLWKLDMDARPRDENQERYNAEAKAWASQSFELGKEASRILSPAKLDWAFAINHCAFVGLMMRLEREEIDEYLQKLIRFESVPAFWNARFADTLGYYHLREAERVQQACQSEEWATKDMDRHLDEARRYLMEAKRLDIGDIDVNEHLYQLDKLQGRCNETTKDR